ncbi:MAG: C-terminal binding protein [Thermodesulfobacteriota bacterium]
MTKIVLTDVEMKMLHSVWGELQALGDIRVTDNDDEETLIKEVSDADLIIICYAGITRKVIQSGKNLKAVLKWGVGVDSIDMEAATEYGMPVCHCPTYGSGTIADHAFATLIAMARKLVPLVNATRRSGWIWPEPSREWAGVDLEGKTVGLVGFGRIARKMVRRCAGFDMKILAYDPVCGAVPSEFDFVEMTSLEDLVQRSDFISMHAVLNRETHHIIGAKEIDLMKSSAYIINTARGALLHEPSLLAALKDRRIAGAAIDVFESEPLDSTHPFYVLDNVLITPHFAYYTEEADGRLDRECLYSARRILNDDPLVNVKNGDILESIGKAVDRLPYGELPYSLND